MVTLENSPYKLLVVDDEDDVAPMFRQSMRRDVRRGKYELLFAGSGLEALECLDREPNVDLVITDINMPEMDGLELLGRLSERSYDLRSVVLSAYGDMKNIRTAMSLGAVDFVTKPVDFDDMKETIERTLCGLEQWREAISHKVDLLSLKKDLDLAGRIQQSMLPTEFPELDNYGAHALLEPASEVAGDFYDVMRLDKGRLGLLIADVSGKGVPAALFMMASRTLLRGAAIGLGHPARILAETNALMCPANSQAMFATVLFGILNPYDGSFEYANAGHMPPLLVRADGSVKELETSKDVALGLMPEAEYEQFKISLGPGELLFMYTDGVTEAMNGTDEFGQSRLNSVVSELAGKSAEEVCAGVLAAVREFSGPDVQSDDITCVALRGPAIRE